MKDILVFGTGEVGQIAIHLLEEEYHILFAVDNDKRKWGNLFEGYEIKSPSEILKYDCDIVIISTRYMIDISFQLLQMGIEKERIFFSEIKLVDGSLRYGFCPLDVKNVKPAGKKLIQYDLLNEEEQETDCIRVLVFCTWYSVYTKQLIENISKRYNDIEFSLITMEKRNKDEIVASQLKHIYLFGSNYELKDILEQIPEYDAAQLLWIEPVWAFFDELIRSKVRKLNLNVGGSDFYRAGKAELDFKKKLIASADKVTAETKGTIQEFSKYYKKEAGSKMGFLPFGVEVLDFIKLNINKDKNDIKRKLNIPLDKIVIACGYNAIEEHQHMKIIDAISQLREDVKEQIVCVFRMTYPYGREDYIESVRNRLEERKLDYLILTEFMDFQSVAECALISDIMIHVQTTDQLSSTMLEEMYSGSIVIAGSWLPYKSLHEMGIYFLDVDVIPDITAILNDVITNIEEYKEKCRGNADIVWKHSSWDELAPRWRALWD